MRGRSNLWKTHADEPAHRESLRGSVFVPWIFIALLLLGGAGGWAEELPFVVVVNAANPAETLEVAELAWIYVKRIDRWKDGTPVEPFDQESTTRVRAAFSMAVYGKSVETMLHVWQRVQQARQGIPPDRLGSDHEVLTRVRDQLGAIGYVSPDALPAPGVKALRLVDLDPERVAASLVAEPLPPSARSREQLPASTRALAIGPRGALYVSAVEGSLLRSFDGGEIWEALDVGRSGAVRDVIAHPLRPETLLVGTETELLLSTDGGTSFRGFVIPRGVRRLFIDPSQPTVVEILAGDGTYWRLFQGDMQPREHTDALQNAAGLDTGRVEAFAVHPSGGLRAASVEGRILWSSDGGGLWKSSRMTAMVVDLAFRPDVNDTLFVATTEGLWRITGLWPSPDNMTLRIERTSFKEPLRRIFASSKALFALSSSALWIGDLEGKQWRQVTAVEVGELVIDPQAQDRWTVLNTQGGVMSTSDDGGTWVDHDTTRRPLVGVFGGDRTRGPNRSFTETLHLRCGHEGAHVAALATVPGEVGRVYAGGLHGVWRSEDAGRSWTYSSHGLELTDVHALAVDPKRSEILWAGTHGGGLYRSIDAGASWWRTSGPAVVHALAIDPLVTHTIWVGTPSGLWVSEDDGETWRSADSSPHGRLRVRDILLDASDPLAARAASAGLREGSAVTGDLATGTLLGFSERTEIVSGQCDLDDGALSAEVLGAMDLDPAALPIRALAFDAEGERLYAATPFGLWARDDRGSWRRLGLEANLSALARLQVEGEEVLLAGAADGIWQASRGSFGAALDESRRLTKDGRLARERRPELFATGSEPFDSAVYSLATDSSETFYAGLDRGRLVVARQDPVEDAFVWRMVKLPTSAPRAVQRRGERPVVELSGARPAEVRTAAGSARRVADAELWWRRLVATPSFDVRARALLAIELLGQLPGSDAELARALLEDLLQELADPPSSLRLDRPSQIPTFRGLSFSPNGRWLMAEHRFADRERFHSELRLYDLAAIAKAIPSGRLTGGAPDWWAIHDLALEPVHLQPQWILPDAGDVLAWGPGGDHLLTQAAVGKLRVWHLGAVPPGAGGLVPLPSVAQARTIELAPELAAELVGGLVPTFREVLEVAAFCRKNHCSTRVEVPPLAGRVALSHDGRRIAFPGRDADGALLHLLVPEGEAHILHAFRLPGEVPPHLLHFTRDDAWLLSFESDPEGTHGTARAWHLDTWLRPLAPGTGPRQAPGPFQVASRSHDAAVLSPDGRWLVTRAGRNSTLWNLEKWDLAAMTPESPGQGLLADASWRAPRFAPGGDWLSAETRSGESLLWHLGADGPTQVLAVAMNGRLPVFGGGGFLLQGRSSSDFWRLDKLPLRQEIRGGAAGAAAPLARWESLHGKADSGELVGPAAPFLRSSDNVWHAAVREDTLWLWHLAALDPGGRLVRVGRYGPVGLHLDEGPPPKRARWVGKLRDLPIGELRDLACQLVGEGLTKDELSRLARTVAWDSICTLRVKREK